MKASGMVRVLSDKYTEREKKSVRGDSFIPGLTKTHFFCGWKVGKNKKKRNLSTIARCDNFDEYQVDVLLLKS